MRLKGVFAWTAVLPCVAVVLGIAWLSNPGGTAPSTVSDALDSLPWSQSARLRKLDAKGESIAERKARKVESAQALVRGELTIDEAAAEVRLALSEDEEVLSGLRHRYAGARDEELALRNLAGHVRALGLEHEALAAEVEAEADRRFPSRRAREAPSDTPLEPR